jgi:hypothetical protein
MFATSISVLSEFLSALITLPPELSGDSITCSAKLVDSIIKHNMLIDSNNNVLNLETWHLHWDETIALLKSMPEQNFNTYNFEQQAKKIASLMQPDSKKNYAHTLDQVHSAWRDWQDKTIAKATQDFKLGVKDSVNPKAKYDKMLKLFTDDKKAILGDKKFIDFYIKIDKTLNDLSNLYTEMERSLTAKNGGINPLSENAPEIYPKKRPGWDYIDTLFLLGIIFSLGIIVWAGTGELINMHWREIFGDDFSHRDFAKWLKDRGIPHPWPWMDCTPKKK